MTTIEARPHAADAAPPFPSLASLRAAHGELLRRRHEGGGSPTFLADLAEFIRIGRLTGALLDSDAERDAAQGLLDYWATALYRVGQEPPDAALADFDPELAPELPDTPCPYLGLDAFSEDSYGLFFGCRRLIDDWLERLRETIEQPAELVGLKFEAGVVDELVKEMLGEPAGLPLLQFTLLKLWEQRLRNRVTREAYRRLGGARQALEHSADVFYERLIPQEQVTARRIMLRLVRPGEGLEVTSNRKPREDLYRAGEARVWLDRLLDDLVAARLVRLIRGETPADDQVEVAHEALVRNWRTLVRWLDEERASLRQRLRLTAAAEQWEASGRDPGALLRGALLEEALASEQLNQLETAFVQASRAAVEAAEREEAARRRELDRAPGRDRPRGVQP